MRARWSILLFSMTFLLFAMAAIAQTPTTSQVVGDLEAAKTMTNQKKYDDAIARAEAAIAKLKTLRDTPRGQADITIVSIFQQGENVSVVVKNNGNGNYDTLVQGNVFYPGLDVQLYMVPAGGGQDAKWQTNGRKAISGGMKPGQTQSVTLGGFGCGTRQKIYARVDSENRIPESDENNNKSETIEVVARSCSS